MSDDLLDLSKRTYDHQIKYDYWLMTIAAAAIAFVVSNTRDSTLSWYNAPLGIAVFFWIASILSGFIRQSAIDIVLQADFALVAIQRKLDRRYQTPEEIEEATSVIQQKRTEKNQQAGRCQTRQLECLITGGVAYLVWHVFQMYLRTGVTVATRPA
jgi:hypothetical protein